MKNKKIIDFLDKHGKKIKIGLTVTQVGFLTYIYIKNIMKKRVKALERYTVLDYNDIYDGGNSDDK